MTEYDITQIRIGKHKVGIIGLKSAIEEMAKDFVQKPDDIIAVEFLHRISAQNYIPNKVKEIYGRAFVREFRKFLGQPYKEERLEILEVKVLGPGCAQCDRLESEVMDILNEMNLPANIEHVRDLTEIGKYGILGMPALIINDKVVCVGKIPSKSKIKKWLEDAQKLSAPQQM
jgi:small redox-active disulfide protein 2